MQNITGYLSQRYNANIKTTPQLFHNLSEQALGRLLSNAVVKSYAANTLLIEQGSRPDYIYLVLSGAVKTLRLDAEGNEAIIRLLEPGDTCMEAVLYMNIPSPITVQTTSKADILHIPYAAIRQMVLCENQLSQNLLAIIARHYKNAIHQVDAMSIKSPVQRLGYYLLIKHLEKGGSSTSFELPFKKSTIANYLGMTPETFSRALKEVKKLGIDTDGDTITLKDTFALCTFCDTDTASLCGKEDKTDCLNCPIYDKTS